MESGKPSWYAVVTKPRQEQTALLNLQRQGFECFLPMADNPYQRMHRVCQKSVEPLFPGYLFLSAIAESQNLAPVRSTRGVNGMVRFGLELAVIPEYIINAIKQRIIPDTGLVKIEPVRIKTGDEVRIFDGPLAGMNGIVQEKSSENRVILLMKLLGRPTRVKLASLVLQKTG